MFDRGDVREGEYDVAAEAPESWRVVDTQLRRLAARRCALDAAEAHWLRLAKRAELHWHLGFGSLVEYLERTLGYRPRTALERIRVAEALADLPQISAALEAARISYSTVREISRIATADTERAWLEHAAGKTVREVEAMVAGRSPGDDPSDPTDPDLEPRHLRLALTPDVYARFLAARRALEEETGERLSDDDVMGALCDAALAPGERRGPRHQIALTICESCDRGWQDAAGQVVEVTPVAIAQARCDAQTIGRVDADAPAPITADIPAAVRRQVERRDHGRCVVPGCRCSRYLHIHHIVPRAQGGAHVAPNMALVCTVHHRAVHEGRLQIRGEASALTFAHGDGRPYGTPPMPADDHAAETWLALQALGFSTTEAAAAAEHARAHAGAARSLEDWIRTALRACRRPTPRPSTAATETCAPAAASSAAAAAESRPRRSGRTPPHTRPRCPARPTAT